MGGVMFGLVSMFFLHVAYLAVQAKGYETGAGIVASKLNVHLVPHSHDDVGWLKTIDQYYVGSNNSIQGACVEDVLDSVFMSLLRDPYRKFVFAEMAFFDRWWRRQIPSVQQAVRKLVDNGQLEFVNGGWCMHDEATTHYIDMIDQTTLGHQLIKDQFNKTPRAGWQIDPFGHSAVQAYLLGAEVGFDSVHFARIDYQDRAKRKGDKSLEVIWRGSKTFGSSLQLFANAFPVHYSPPQGFHFEVFDDFEPVQDDPLLFDYNVNERVEDFVAAALIQANVTRTNHIMWTMGDDFQYSYAESWFKQMDKLIHYVNQDGRVNALYSTPSIYTDAKNAANESWPLKTEDYFPYADSANAYWTGFYTSRPALKGPGCEVVSNKGMAAHLFTDFVRLVAHGSLKSLLTLRTEYPTIGNITIKYATMRLLGKNPQPGPTYNDQICNQLVVRQLEFVVKKRSSKLNTSSLGDALGIAQHHDAVTGTAKQHTTNDYAKRLAFGASEAEKVANKALSCLVDSNANNQCDAASVIFSQCQLLNISFCPPTEENIPEDKSLVVLVYNPLGWNRSDIVRFPVNDRNLVVHDSEGNTVEAQYVEVDNVTANLRNFYVEAYLGISNVKTPKYWISFPVSVPPMGWNTYFISKKSQKGHRRRGSLSLMDLSKDETIEIGPGNLKMQFSSSSGQLKRMFNRKTEVDIPIQQSYLWYASSEGDSDPQSSGAYIFRPDGSPRLVSEHVTLKVVRGPLFDEIHQAFDSWIYQVTRVYRDKDHAEVEFTIGPIPTEDVGKEVITRMTANMASNKTYYTDSNGRDFIQRVRNSRIDWNLAVTQPVAGNYYPVNLGIFIEDGNTEFSVLVDRAVGAASINDGQLELMLHRRINVDDSRGVGEPLDEKVCVGSRCEGLKIRGNYYMNINKKGTGSKWRRKTGQEIYSPLLLAFTHEKSDTWKASKLSTASAMDQHYSLPHNVALITLQELDNGNVLLRLAHLYEVGEDAEYSTLAKVELLKMFAGKTIKGLQETSLSANQEKSAMKKMVWNVEGDDTNEPEAVRGGPVNMSTLVVELGPMEIRTFLIRF